MVYVDDILLCGGDSVICELTKAIRAIWKTSDLQLVSDGGIRFLGMDISVCQQGYALSQKSYIDELVRLHNIPPNRQDLIPISKDQATFIVEEQESVYDDMELKCAQQCAGELLWISQRTRPDISYVASLVGSLSTRAPRRAVQIAEKTIAYLQRTSHYVLIYQGERSGLTACCDASFAPDGAKSHSGWLIFLNDCVIAWKSGRQSTITLSTAEAELTAMSEAVLALQSADAMVKDVLPQGQPLQIYSDSTAALAIANGSGSWRTRHLRLRSAWVAELVEKQAISIHHCIGELQPADLLTKALASQRIRALNELLNLRSLEGAQNYVNNASTNTGSSSARAPNQVSRVLIALLVLSQAFLGETHSWEEEEALVVRTGMSVDYGMITWALLWLAVIVILVSWEMLKWFMWLVYDRATPGSTSRRLKRLQKLREATAEAIQKEVQLRTTTKGEQRARDAATEPLGQLPNPPRGTRTLSSSGREGRMTQDERDQLLRKVARGMKQYQDCGVQAGFTECTPSQQVRVILRYVHEPPGEAFFVPGNECYHVYGDCHAFRHRGTMGRVENRRIYQYCVNRARDDPDKSAEYGRDLERAQEYERIFNTQLRVSGQSVGAGSSDAP